MPEHEILALTFTRSAAEEMRMRTKAGKDTLRTLHSWALSRVRIEVSQFEPPLQHFPLLLPDQQFKVVLPIAKKLRLDYKDLTGYISNCKRQGIGPRRALEEAEHERQADFAKAYRQYEWECRKAGLLDFDSIIWELVLLFERKPEVCNRHQIKYLMVDEAQDCSDMDWKLIRLITREHGNIWVVGDFAQSIYGFRGSSPQIFAGFNDLFPGARTLPMGTNYRSQAKIVEYSKKVMPEETSYLLNWKAHKPPTSDPVFSQFVDEFEEAAWVLDHVQLGHCVTTETAILARTNAQLAIMQGECALREIPYKLLGRDNFWKRSEVLALLGLVKNAVGIDDNGIANAIQSPLPCVRFLRKDAAVTALKKLQQGSVGQIPLKTLLNRVDVGDHGQNQVLQKLSAIITTASTLSSQGPATMMKFIAESTGARELIDDDVDSAHETFVQENIRKVVQMASYFKTVADLSKFVNAAGRPSRKQTKLILSTVHGFKGLEAKNVFVIGVNLGTFPHDRAELQEEKRLYYVAVSRPTEKLYVTCGGIPSPFIQSELEVQNPEDNDPWANFQLYERTSR